MAGRVLMVAYHFPPSAAVAAQRPHKFAKYLPEFGWKPGVLCRAPDPLVPRDESFVPEIAAGMPLRRISPIEPLRMSGFLGKWIGVPDEQLGWQTSLLSALPEEIRKRRPDALYVSSVPVSSLVEVAVVARRMGIPWIADFHNEWTRNMYYRPPTALHDAIHRRLEAFVVNGADAVITLNPLHTEELRSRFPGVRCETIENGFDPADYSVAPPVARPPWVFTYAGAVYGHQSPEPFLKALAATGRKDVEVRIVGDRFGQCRVGEFPFPVSVRRHLPHRELGETFSESSAFFLCLETPAARQLPAKLYEYARTGRPVFAIVPRDGAADRWIRENRAGVSVPVEEPARWAPELEGFIASIQSYRAPALECYDRRALAGKLAGILDRLKT